MKTVLGIIRKDIWLVISGIAAIGIGIASFIW